MTSVLGSMGSRATRELFPAADELEHNILSAEHLRVTILAAGGAFALLLNLIGLLLVRERFETAVGAKVPMELFAVVIATFLVYELLVRRGLRWLLDNRRRPHPAARYGNALVEAAFPTMILLLFASTRHPAYVLTTPIAFVYYIFIGLSALRLDWKLSALTGLLSDLGYLLVYFSTVGAHAGTVMDPAFTRTLPYFGRGAMFFLTGLSVSFVAAQLRKRLESTLSLVEERNRLVNIFGQHVSPQVVNKLLAQKSEWGSESRFVCVMFLDIRNFTRFCEGKTPEEVVALLNRLFEFMVDAINEHGGIINKFLGDGFMAVFGAPFSEGNACVQALAASRAILERLEEQRASGTIADTRVGIGLHAGNVVTGNIGSARRKEYTIIGDTVNLASRIESLNKEFGSSLLVSDSVRAEVQQAGVDVDGLKDLGPVKVKGRQQDVNVYQAA